MGPEFFVLLPIKKGIHRYKFIVDGEWRFSPDDQTSPDEEGNINNVIDTNQYVSPSACQTTSTFMNSNLNNSNLTPENILRSFHNEPKTTFDPLIRAKKSKSIIDAIYNDFDLEAPLSPPHLTDIYFVNVKRTNEILV